MFHDVRIDSARFPLKWSAEKVKCVPGGHDISLSDAYWCNECDWYICYMHLKKAMMTTEVKCPKGHHVSKVS
ncbi:MAG: hypothetical protein KF736_09670 [Acidobacteria bacterium]|nr:hypothetical protein [Acidobacteriota bacterium]MCW5949873.1 hypothetical protein [Pyrinomonadaceae bacterium]